MHVVPASSSLSLYLYEPSRSRIFTGADRLLQSNLIMRESVQKQSAGTLYVVCIVLISEYMTFVFFKKFAKVGQQKK